MDYAARLVMRAFLIFHYSILYTSIYINIAKNINHFLKNVIKLNNEKQ